MRMGTGRRIARAAVGLATVAAVMAVAAPAQAASAGCTVGLFGSSCTTGTIPHNGRQIAYFVMGGTAPCFEADFAIYERSSGRRVFSRHVGSGSVSGTTYPVTGGRSYYGKITNSCWDAEASISTT